MNKKKMIRLTALVGVATATGVVVEANQAHAATTTTTETTNQTTNASVESTQAAVDAAQSAFDTAQTSVDNAQANVTSASNNVTSASATLSSAIANKEAATSENIASATSAVSSQAVVVASASQAVSEQAGVVSAAASVQASAQAEATSASASLSSSSANVASATSALSAAEAALTSDQSTAANNLSAAESAASSASAAVSSGQAAVDNAQAAVASAQAIVDAVAEVQSSDVINMSVAYITALKNYLANPSSANAAALQEVAKGADYVKELQQKFKSDASLDVVVDPSDPTVQEALSVYAVNLINHLRNQYGLTTAFGASANANVAAIDFVKKYYDDEDWNIFGTTGKGHNKNGLDAYANQLNTSIAEDAGSGLTTWVNGKATMATTTLHNLLYAVYSDIATMLFDDGGTNNWSHAQSIFEDGTILGTGGFNNVYLGVAFDKYGYAHYELYNATEGNHLGNNAYSLDVQTAAQALLTNAQASLASAKASLQRMTTNLMVAKAAVVAAQNQLAALENSSANDLVAVTKARTQLASAETSYQTALATYKQKEEALKKAGDNLAAAQASLEAAQATLATAKAKLAELEETVANLTNADQLLAAAQAAYEQAVANLTTATGNLGAAQVDLAKAESQLALAEDTAEQAKVRAAIAAQVDQQLNGSTANDRQSAGQDATSLKTNGRALTATVATASAAKQKQGANQGRLPQTGNDDQEASTMALVGLGMLGMATGLYGYKKKKLTK